MNEFEIIVVNDGTNDITLYPLLEIRYNNKKYIFYLNEIKRKIEKKDIHIGEITKKNELNPVDSKDLSYFQILLDSVIIDVNRVIEKEEK